MDDKHSIYMSRLSYRHNSGAGCCADVHRRMKNMAIEFRINLLRSFLYLDIISAFQYIFPLSYGLLLMGLLITLIIKKNKTKQKLEEE
jgi:hypothetical protein